LDSVKFFHGLALYAGTLLFAIDDRKDEYPENRKRRGQVL
jgi:hypothetical protein